jgi:hypothetical protein
MRVDIPGRMPHTSCMMKEATAPNAIETRTNTHRLFGQGTACNPTKLPKGELFVEDEMYEVTTTDLDTGKFIKVMRPHTVLCNKCNKVDHRGF